MKNFSLNQINRELAQQNYLVAEQLDELMQEVMADNDICERSDWDEIQKTMSVMIQCAEIEPPHAHAPNYTNGSNTPTSTANSAKR